MGWDVLADPVIGNAISGTLGAVVGMFLGHKLTVDHDRRKEYNALIREINAGLDRAIENPTAMKVWGLSAAQRRDLSHWLTRRNFSRLCAACERYEQSHRDQSYQDSCGQPLLRDAEQVRRAAVAIQALLKVR